MLRSRNLSQWKGMWEWVEWSGVLQHFWLEVVSLIVSAFCDAKIYVHEVFPAFAKSNHFSFPTRENLMQLVFVPKSQPKLFPFISFRSSYLMRGKSCAGIESWENKSRDPRLCIDNRRRCGINEPIYPSCFCYQCGASTSRQAIPLRSGKQCPWPAKREVMESWPFLVGVKKRRGISFSFSLCFFCLLHVWLNLILLVQLSSAEISFSFLLQKLFLFVLCPLERGVCSEIKRISIALKRLKPNRVANKKLKLLLISLPVVPGVCFIFYDNNFLQSRSLDGWKEEEQRHSHANLGAALEARDLCLAKCYLTVNKLPLFVLLFVCLSPSVHSLKKKPSTRKENERSFPSCRTQHKPNWPIIMKITKLAKLLLNLALRDIRWCRDNWVWGGVDLWLRRNSFILFFNQ